MFWEGTIDLIVHAMLLTEGEVIAEENEFLTN